MGPAWLRRRRRPGGHEGVALAVDKGLTPLQGAVRGPGVPFDAERGSFPRYLQEAGLLSRGNNRPDAFLTAGGPHAAADPEFVVEGGVPEVGLQDRSGQVPRQPGAIQRQWHAASQPETLQVHERCVGCHLELRCRWGVGPQLLDPHNAALLHTLGLDGLKEAVEGAGWLFELHSANEGAPPSLPIEGDGIAEAPNRLACGLAADPVGLGQLTIGGEPGSEGPACQSALQFGQELGPQGHRAAAVKGDGPGVLRVAECVHTGIIQTFECSYKWWRAGMPQVVTIETPGLGDRSYLIHDGQAGFVVDPQRDIDRVLAAAKDAGVRITHVAETHVHNDYVTGGLELSRLLEVPYLVAAAEDVSFARYPVADGDEIDAGTMHIRVITTPGHTPHHLSYFVEAPGEPSAVFTGGSLLYGTVGRTDLIGPAATEALTRAQHRSVRKLAGAMPDDVAVWPTHGFGSFCSSAKSSGASTSSLGEERRSNLAFTVEDEEAFVRLLLGGLTAYPTYYARMGPINRAGPAPIDLRPPRMVQAEELNTEREAGAWVVDMAERRAYARRHLRGSASIPSGDQFATYLGWVLPWGAPLILVADAFEEVAEAQRALARIGVDHLRGAATGSRALLAGKGLLASYPVSTFGGMREARQAEPALVVVDVRRDDERAQGGIEGSVHLPLQDLTARMSELPAGEVWVHCASGFRASIAASLLARAGRDVVLVDDEWPQAASAGLSMASPGRS